MSYKESLVYIDIESIFDTRLATIAKMNKTIATNLLLNHKYWERDTNHWSVLTDGGINDAEFDELFAKRDIETLKASYITSIFAPLAKLIADNKLAIADGAPNKDISLDINIHPYILEPEEMDVFIKLFQHRIGFDCKITFCSVPPNSLTPQYMVKRYAAAFMYDFNSWIKLHLAGLIKVKHPDFNLVIPKLFERDVSKLSIDDKKDELMVFRLYMLEYMDISFIDVSCFSVLRV